LDILEIDSVIKSYNSKQILTDIYLKCSTGDIIGLLGRNGIGKSTLMKIIFGSLEAENKFIRINQEVIDKPYKKRNLVLYLPQDGFLLNDLTVEQNTKLYFKPDDVYRILDDDLLQKVAKTRISDLSGGEERYLEIKLLLFTPTKFLLLDEPFNGVSPIIVDCIKKLIKLKSDSMGIILTDHDYRNVLDIANKYYMIFDGGIKYIENKNDLIKWGYLPETKK
jgi:ABC-type lipopolysaccharide export system ATPase subunit